MRYSHRSFAAGSEDCNEVSSSEFRLGSNDAQSPMPKLQVERNVRSATQKIRYKVRARIDFTYVSTSLHHSQICPPSRATLYRWLRNPHTSFDVLDCR